MKRMLIACLILLGSCAANAQAPKDSLPYQKYPTLPAFNLASLDSSRIFNTYNIQKGRPTVLYFFSPDCDHCHITSREMLAKMDSMKAADFYFFSFMPLSSIRAFAAQHQLARYKNIFVGKDYQFFFPSFYGATTVPYLVIYDGQKKLVKLFDDTIRMPEVISLIQKSAKK